MKLRILEKEAVLCLYILFIQLRILVDFFTFDQTLVKLIMEKIEEKIAAEEILFNY